MDDYRLYVAEDADKVGGAYKCGSFIAATILPPSQSHGPMSLYLEFNSDDADSGQLLMRKAAGTSSTLHFRLVGGKFLIWTCGGIVSRFVSSSTAKRKRLSVTVLPEYFNKMLERMEWKNE